MAQKEKIEVVLSQRMVKKLEELIRTMNQEMGLTKDEWHKFSFEFKLGSDGQDLAQNIRLTKQNHE
jgi:hypothetical protein